MDNLTHSLIGAGFGEAAGRRAAARPWYWFASILANNSPDSDVFIPLFLGEKKITGLLHHRGHTHTYFVGLLLAFACYGIVLGVARLFGKRFTATEKRMVLGLTVLGNFLHIFADSWNSYGVHPYWPFSSKWFFGDFIFIVEPWIWLALAPALFFAARTRIAKGFFAVVLLFLLLLVWQVPLLHITARVVLTAAIFLFPLAYRWVPEAKRIYAALGLVAVTLVSFWTIKHFVRAQIAALHTEDVYDAAITPFPGDPFCWSAFILLNRGNDYRIQIATLAPFPKVFDVSYCPPSRVMRPTAPLVPLQNSRNDIHWIGEFRGELRDLRMLAEKSCKARAVLKFLRMPYWLHRGGSRWVLGDLRFDRDESVGFTEFELDMKDEACPPAVPGWVEPVAPLLKHE